MLIVEQGSGIVCDANDAVCVLLGVEAPALLEQPLRALQQHLDANVLEDLARSLDANGALSAMPLRLARADGQVRDCLVSAGRMQVVWQNLLDNAWKYSARTTARRRCWWTVGATGAAPGTASPTTAPASTWAAPGCCSNPFSACTPPTSSPAPASV
jgi:PAS domain-containing protein